MSISPAQIGNLKYGVLYLPSLVYAYLSFQPMPPTFEFLGATLPQPQFYPLGVVLTLFSAVFFQKVGIAIFGHGGPPMNPKVTIIALLYSIPFTTPVSVSDWDIEEFDSWWDVINQITESMSRWNFLPVVVFLIVMLSGWLLHQYALFPLTYYIVTGHVDYVGGLLWIAMAASYFNVLFENEFPVVGDPDSADRIAKPEYVHYRELMLRAQAEDESEMIQTRIEDTWSESTDQRE